MEKNELLYAQARFGTPILHAVASGVKALHSAIHAAVST
jgi:hypothetical protein